MMDWALDLLFARDIEQMMTLRDVEALSDLAGRIHARETQRTSVTAVSTLEAAVHDQLKRKMGLVLALDTADTRTSAGQFPQDFAKFFSSRCHAARCSAGRTQSRKSDDSPEIIGGVRWQQVRHGESVRWRIRGQRAIKQAFASQIYCLKSRSYASCGPIQIHRNPSGTSIAIAR